MFTPVWQMSSVVMTICQVNHLQYDTQSRLKHGVEAANCDTRDKKVKQGLQNTKVRLVRTRDKVRLRATPPRLLSVAAKKLSLRPPYQPLRIPNNVR